MGRRGNTKRKEPEGDIARYEANLRTAEDQSYLDVITPEMAAKGCYQAENRGRRYFKLQHLDRLHKNGKLTYEQHQAGSWYREQYDRGQYDRPAATDYSRPRGENVVELVPHNSQQKARDAWREARKQWPKDMLGFMDAFLLRDRLPQRHHRAQMRQLADIRRALDAMASHIRLVPLDRAEHFV